MQQKEKNCPHVSAAKNLDGPNISFTILLKIEACGEQWSSPVDWGEGGAGGPYVGSGD